MSSNHGGLPWWASWLLNASSGAFAGPPCKRVPEPSQVLIITARLRSTLYGAQCSCLIRDRLSRPKKAVGRQDRESEADHSIGVGSRALFPFSLLNMESRSVVCAVRQRNWPTAVPLHVALSSSFCLVGTQQLESAECSSFHAACMAELR